MASSRNVSLFRNLIRELNLSHVKSYTPLNKTPAYQYIVDQFRQYKLTASKLCRGENEVEHMARTYLCYLESSRKHEALHNQYKGSPDRSIEESARLVGLQVPDVQKETWKYAYDLF